jgi:hypothetical protein
MRQHSIEPIVIFDGRPPAAKSDVVDQRRVARQAAQTEIASLRTEIETGDKGIAEKAGLEQQVAAIQKKNPQVTGAEKDEVKQFLYAAGILFITAAGEADDFLAFLCRSGRVQGVISTDMDMLARGIPTLFLPETPDCGVITEISLNAVLTGLQLTYGQFVDACQLMGSDYSCKGFRTLDPRQAVVVAAKGVDWGTIDVSGSICCAMERGVHMLRGDGVNLDTLLSEKQRVKWDAGAPACEPENIQNMSTLYGWPCTWLEFLSVSR